MNGIRGTGVRAGILPLGGRGSQAGGWDTGPGKAALGAVPVGRSRAQMRCKGRVHPTVQARSDLQRSTAFK